jgi:hypothetical protein
MAGQWLLGTRKGSFHVQRAGGAWRIAHSSFLGDNGPLAVDATGLHLAFGSTTGSVWTSDDAGDHWQCLRNHLPPVYCVRYAA